MLYTFNTDKLNKVEQAANELRVKENRDVFYLNGILAEVCAELMEGIIRANEILGRISYNGVESKFVKDDIPAKRLLAEIETTASNARRELDKLTGMMNTMHFVYPTCSSLMRKSMSSNWTPYRSSSLQTIRMLGYTRPSSYRPKAFSSTPSCLAASLMDRPAFILAALSDIFMVIAPFVLTVTRSSWSILVL